MLDIIILYILVKRIKVYANHKNQSKLKWGVLLVLNWFMFELLGMSFATHYLNITYNLDFIQANLGYSVLLAIFGIGCGFLGYLLTRKMLDRVIV